jgi:hypothetical protein
MRVPRPMDNARNPVFKLEASRGCASALDELLGRAAWRYLSDPLKRCDGNSGVETTRRGNCPSIIAIPVFIRFEGLICNRFGVDDPRYTLTSDGWEA